MLCQRGWRGAYRMGVRALRPHCAGRRSVVDLATVKLSEQVSESDLAAEPKTYGKVDPSLPDDFISLELGDERWVSPDSKILTFLLPTGGPLSLAATGIPSAVKVRHTVADVLLDKSYSPISPPWKPHSFDLLVKSYPLREGGGLGQLLCSMNIGETTEIKFKPQRYFWGKTYTANCWDHILLIAGGTGVAPLFQMVSAVLGTPEDRTRMSVVTCNRTANNILLGSELDALAAKHPERLEHYPILSQPPPDWIGGVGHVTVQDLGRALRNAGTPQRRMALVCGTDGFLETVCGDKIRLPAQTASESPRKVQGPVRGLLRDLGYATEEVTRM